MKITGIMVYYYFVCKRKLWYFSKDITMEHNSELVEIGKILDEYSYNRKKKSILVDDIINIDFIEDWKIIHEIKKSKSIEEASIWQVKYYIYMLNKLGVEIEKAIIDYPLIKEREVIDLKEKDIVEMEKVLDEIKNIINSKNIPKDMVRKSICNKCAYYELCYV
ncbi:CRISPR-associated protein Cas4 [Miniphocaeibacter halophilus]|uniref:CRISPR-associated protein Cas4 n=1 Tax=Miniphocaeibacter halophilus TaxID=2931922 RepID=A0AC61N1I0_9FIRM|nr:CRISPR-associated protein Cas4 [Miniphocaeibacter halophilus]QQK08748.1 CRISPR-associated protein Cas4 [Miniphocaeibacter halophilus]